MLGVSMESFFIGGSGMRNGLLAVSVVIASCLASQFAAGQ